MENGYEKTEDLLRYYHRLATVALNTYIQLQTMNPIDVRLDAVAKTYNRYACMFNLYNDLRRKRGETRKSDS